MKFKLDISFNFHLLPKHSISCKFCSHKPETLQHLFYDCPKVVKLWSIIEDWLLQKGSYIQLNRNTVLFGIINSKNIFINWLIITVKYYIYIYIKQNFKKSV